MCGIAALGSSREGIGGEDLVSLMLGQMLGRGDRPAETASLRTGTLGCVRLAIVDREAGKQPVFNEQGDVAVAFNGEIYNHRALCAELRRVGHRFVSECDTEVLVHGYEEWGLDLLARLSGMYAFVVVDDRNKRILAARDPFGIKPLYYAKLGDQILFASAIKALLRVGAYDVKLVPPGGTVDNGVESSRRLFLSARPVEIGIADARTELRRLLRESVCSMLDTDLTVAVFCSGGIDSSAVLYEAAQSGASVVAYAIGTSHEAADIRAAKLVAGELGVPFRAVVVDSETLLQSVPAVIEAIESFEPNHIRGGTLSFALARAVHEDGVKVALCGEGADELLAGYPEFQLCLDTPDPGRCIDKEIRRFTLELHKTQLQRVDRTNMEWAVEVRVPYLDLALASFALSLPPTLKLRLGEDGRCVGKDALREAYRGLLPDEIVERRKIVLSDGAGMGDNTPAGPFYEYACSQISDAKLDELRSAYPEYQLRDKEEAFYFSIFHSLYGPLPLATERPRVNTLATGA